MLRCMILTCSLVAAAHLQASAGAETSAPLTRAQDEEAPVWAHHDQITPLPGAATPEQTRHLPIFAFTPGTCMPSAAVDAASRLGSGLKASGRMNGHCPREFTANIYTKTLVFGDVTAIAYALYFPKDGSNPGSVGGHRHDFEYVIVWVKDQEITGITFNQHRGWYTMPRQHLLFVDDRAVVMVGKAKHGMYHTRNDGPGGLIEGICYFCDTREFPGLSWLGLTALVDVEQLAPKTQHLLSLPLWGKANSPFRADVFAANARSIAEGALCRDRGCKCDVQTGRCPGFP